MDSHPTPYNKSKSLERTPGTINKTVDSAEDVVANEPSTSGDGTAGQKTHEPR